MSTPTPAPQPNTFADVETTLKSDEKSVINGALEYLEAALKTSEGQVDVVVQETSDDAETYAFQIAAEHGFSSYLSLFKSAIDGGKATVEASISTETHAAIEQGIAKVKSLEQA